MSAYSSLSENVRNCALSLGRDPQDITVVSVSKGRALEEILDSYKQGCRDFGESRVQEALEKIASAPKDIAWHFIGTLQKNKVNKVVGKFKLIHSVDTLELAEKISSTSQSLHLTTSILIQVNTSGEPTKHGLTIWEWRDQFKALLSLPGIELQGLMTMAPLTKEEAPIRASFAALRTFRDELETTHSISLPHLSMGMSNDYPLALAEGATLLRIGTALFSRTS